MTRFPKRLQNEFLTRNGGMDGILFLYLKSRPEHGDFMNLYSGLKNG